MRAIEVSFKQKYPANNGLARDFAASFDLPAPDARNPHDVGGEYAVYMMA